ncbi:hypothetical protein LXL04_000588 [Taraxacum kok-saghyz]
MMHKMEEGAIEAVMEIVGGPMVETVANGDSGVEVTGEQEGGGSPAISIRQEVQSKSDRERRKTNERERWKGSTFRRGLEEV